MKDIKFYHKKRSYDDSPLGKLDKSLTELYGGTDETLGWKFSYKGNKYGYVIYGTKERPLTNRDVINVLELALGNMKRLIKKEKK